MALLDPALQLGGADGIERVGAAQHAQDLEDAVERSSRVLVLLGLRQKRVQVHLCHVPAARELEIDAQRRRGILAGEQPGAVGRQLALAEPFEQRELDREDGDSGEEREGAEAHVEDDDEDGDRKSTRLNSSHLVISYAVFCLKKKKTCTHVY